MAAAAGRSRRCAQANDGTDYPLRYKVPPHGALDKVQFARDHDSFTQTEARALTGGAHGPPWKAKRVVRLPSGDMYQGGFNDAGQLQGLGIYYNADGRLAGGWQEATYVNNSAEGPGAFRWRRAGMGGTGAWAANTIQGGSGGCGWLGHRPFDFSGEYHNDAKADGAVVITFQPDDGGGGVERTMKGPWKGGKPGPFGAFADVDECLVGSGGGGGGGGGSSSSAITCRAVLRTFLKAPVVATLFAIFCSLTPLHGWLVDGNDRDNDAPLQWLFNGIRKVGLAAVPINMFLLGANLATSAKRGWRAAARVVPLRVNLGILLAKMVLMPAFGLLTATVLSQFVSMDNGTGDDSFFLVVMIVTCTPTANSMMVMAEVAGQNKEALAACIFTQYLAAPVLLAISVSIIVSTATSM